MISILSTLLHYTLHLLLQLQINTLHKSTLFIYSSLHKVVQGRLVSVEHSGGARRSSGLKHQIFGLPIWPRRSSILILLAVQWIEPQPQPGQLPVLLRFERKNLKIKSIFSLFTLLLIIKKVMYQEHFFQVMWR